MNATRGLARVGWEPWKPSIGQTSITPDQEKNSRGAVSVPVIILPLVLVAGLVAGYFIGNQMPFGGK